MADAAVSFLDRHHFLLRRLHSLSGIVPVGVFLIFHLLTNSTAFLAPAKFNEEVEWIHGLPYLILLEVCGIFLPIAFHAWYGVIIARSGRSNVQHYGWLDNWRYTLQRVTGWIAIVFILLHLGHFRFAHWFGGPKYQETIAAGTSAFDLTAAGFSLGLPAAAWTTIYVIGLAASVFHFCNGICTFCITWGITVGDVARRRVLLGASGLAVVLMSWGLLSLYALSSVPAKP